MPLCILTYRAWGYVWRVEPLLLMGWRCGVAVGDVVSRCVYWGNGAVALWQLYNDDSFKNMNYH